MKEATTLHEQIIQRANKDLKGIEKRYETENDFLALVATGDIVRITEMINSDKFEIYNFAYRDLTRPLRMKKNSIIILNTLLRKVAYDQGVNPFMIHCTSEEFAYQIENCTTDEMCNKLFYTVMLSYTQLIALLNGQKHSLITKSVLTYIEANLSDSNLSLATISKALGYEKETLSKRIKRETGQRVTEIINQRKVDYAKLLMIKGLDDMATIAQASGFYDSSYFSKTFKKIMGCSPSQYLNTLRTK